MLADELLRTDPVIGAETRLVSLEVTRHLRPLRLKRLVRMHEIGSSHAIPMRNARSGKVALSVPARRLIADDGAVIERRRLLRPLKSANWTLEALAESHWEEIFVTAFTSAWRVEEVEADLIRLAHAQYHGRMSEIARRLGIGRSTLYRKMREYKIDAD